MRPLHQDARAVARVHFAAARAAVVEIRQNRQPLLDDFVGLPAFDVDDKSYATGVVLELRVVETLFGWRSDRFPVAALLLPIIRLQCVVFCLLFP